MGFENVVYKPELSGRSADIVVVGGGPAGMHLVDELRRRNGSSFKPLLLEQADTLGGSALASMQQLRTFQSNRTMVDMIAETHRWYQDIGAEIGQSLVGQLPYLFVAGEDEQLEQYTSTLKDIQLWGHGKDGEVLGQDELRKRFPFVNGEVAGALYYPEAYQLDFEAACRYITQNSPQATFALGTEMTNVIINDGRIVGVDTPQGFVNTDKVVFATGPFVIKSGGKILGGYLEEGAKLSELVEVKKRQRFSATVSGLPPNTKVFVIGPEGQYVRLHTDGDGSGAGDYGYADPDNPIVQIPEINPKATELDFPSIVYSGLGKAMLDYGNEELSGPLAKTPLRGSRKAGYYAGIPDDLPAVCETSVPGLYLTVAHSHAGVMNGTGAAKHMTDIIERGEQLDNPFRFQRNYKKNGIRL